MARIRTIKPELPSDPSLAKCSRDARLTFTYLITQSDDYGFVPAAPRQIVGLLFPHDDDLTASDVGRWVNELVAVGLCEWAWTADGLPLIHLLGWESHQRIDNRRKAVLSAYLRENDHHAPPYAVCDIRHAEVRGEVAAVRGEIPLEPPTSEQDHGPRTLDLRPPVPAMRKPRASRAKKEGVPRPTWITPFEERWKALCGPASWEIGPALREFAILREHYPDEEILRRLDWYVENRGSEVVLPADRLHTIRFTPLPRDFRQRFTKFDPSEPSTPVAA